MTSLTYTTHIFVFVLLNAVDLSKAGCFDLLKLEKWGGSLTDTFSLVTTKDLQSTVRCTLEAECAGGREVACSLQRNCFETKSPECQGKSSETTHFFHFMCLIIQAVATDAACELTSEDISEVSKYGSVCKIYSETTGIGSPPQLNGPHVHSTGAYGASGLTTTPTTKPPTTTTTKPPTTLPETTTATLLPSSTKVGIATLKPTTTTLTETATVLPSLPTTATKVATATTLAEGEKDGNKKDQQLDIPKDTTDNLKYCLMLSVLLNVILPLAVFLYMRRRWTRDRTPWTSSQPTANGNLTNHHPNTESGAPLESTNKDQDTRQLMQNDMHSDDSIQISVNGEEQTVV